MLVRYFMSSPVFTVSPHEACDDVVSQFHEKGVRRVPVMEDGELVGMVTEGDLRSIVPTTVGQLNRSDAFKGPIPQVGEIMAPDPITVEPNDSLAHAASLMIRKKVAGLPVMRDGALVGIITESDVFRALVDIIDHAEGTRVLVREPSSDEPFDYSDACSRLGLELNNLLHHHTDRGATQTLVTVSGEAVEDFLQEIRESRSAVVRVGLPAHEEEEEETAVEVVS